MRHVRVRFRCYRFLVSGTALWGCCSNMSLSVPFSCFVSETLRIRGKVTVRKKPSILPLWCVLGDWSRFAAHPKQYRSKMSHKTQMSDPRAAGVNKSELYCNDPSVSFFGVPTSTLATVFMGAVNDYKMYCSVVKVNATHTSSYCRCVRRSVPSAIYCDLRYKRTLYKCYFMTRI
jgi:hypothetical protein